MAFLCAFCSETEDHPPSDACGGVSGETTKASELARARRRVSGLTSALAYEENAPPGFQGPFVESVRQELAEAQAALAKLLS